MGASEGPGQILGTCLSGVGSLLLKIANQIQDRNPALRNHPQRSACTRWPLFQLHEVRLQGTAKHSLEWLQNGT